MQKSFVVIFLGILVCATGCGRETNRTLAAKKASDVTGGILALSATVGTGLASAIQATPDPNTMYVSPIGDDSGPGTESAPFKTLERARSAAAKLLATPGGQTSDVRVFLRAGRHELTEALKLTPADSGTNGHRVIYTAYGTEKAVVSGGTRLSGAWKTEGNGLYSLSAVTGDFRQLSINGERGVRARTPNAGSFSQLVDWGAATDDGIFTAACNPGKAFLCVRVDAKDAPAWNTARATNNAVEFVVLKNWSQDVLRIDAATPVSLARSYVDLTFKSSEAKVDFESHSPFKLRNQNFYLENALEFLDQENEWYLDKQNQKLYVKMRAGVDPASAEIVAPALESLVEVTGTSESQTVHDIAFANLGFEDSTWLKPSREGFVGSQAVAVMPQQTGPNTIPGAVQVKNARGIVFYKNSFRRLGATGLFFRTGTSDDFVIENTFSDIAGTALAVGDDLGWGFGTKPKREVVFNNSITRIGQDFYGSVGIFLGITEDVSLVHNEITDVPYTGISAGYGWWTSDPGNKNTVIAFNRVKRAILVNDDGAGIYTLAKNPGMILYRNYVSDLTPPAWRLPMFVGFTNWIAISGIYLDENTSDAILVDNVVDIPDVQLSSIPALFLHGAHDNIIVNHRGSHTWAHAPSFTPTDCPDRNDESCLRNTFADQAGFDPDVVRAGAGLMGGI